MTYATQQDMEDRFGEQELIDLTDRKGRGVIDVDALGKALADAFAEINGYLAGRYKLPLSTTPTMLVWLECDIARYRLYGGRPNEMAQTNYDNAVRLLRDISASRAHLNLDAAGEQATPGDGPSADAPERTFTMDTLEGY